MPQVIADISISLDGYVSGPEAGPDLGLGVGGEPIHDWAIEPSDIDREVLDAAVAGTGAVIMGRNTFDVVDGPHGWNDDMGYGARQKPDDAPPMFVVTHAVPGQVRLTDVFTFVTGGVAEAVTEATAAARDRNVVLMGGASVIDQALAAGLVDQLILHISPVLVGGGARLFDGLAARPALRQLHVLESPRATHITYRVLDPAAPTA